MDFLKSVWNRVPGRSLGDKLAVLGLAGALLAAVYGGYEWLYRRDVGSQVEDIKATQDKLASEIKSLKEELVGKVEKRLEGLPGPSGSPSGGAGEAGETIAKDIGAAIKTLATEGKTEALRQLEKGDRDAADKALAAKIAEMETTRGVAAREEAALYRQRGALAFLDNTAEALRFYAKATGLDQDDAEGWRQLGHLQLRVGDLDAAAKGYERMLALGNESGDQAIIATATRHVGIVYFTRGDLDQAEAMYKKALAIDEELGRKEGMARDYGNIGLIYEARRDLDQAAAMYKKALAIDEELGSKEGMASDYGNLGNVYLARGGLDQAEAMYKKAIAIHEAMGSKEGMASDYGNLGNVYFKRGDFDQAEAMYKKSLAIDEVLGRKEYMANQYGNVGLVDQTRGEIAQACVHWRKARVLFRQIGAKPKVEQVEGWMRAAACEMG